MSTFYTYKLVSLTSVEYIIATYINDSCNYLSEAWTYSQYIETILVSFETI